MKEVLFIYSWLPSEFLGTLSYPNNYRMTKFSFICLSNLPRQISKVFVHLEALWRKYLFYISKWHEIYTVSSYAQIITLLQIAAQSKSSMWAQVQFIFYGQIGTLQSKCYIDPLLLPSNFSGTIPCPNHCHMIIFSSIFLVNLSREISKVSTLREALWSKY